MHNDDLEPEEPGIDDGRVECGRFLHLPRLRRDGRTVSTVGAVAVEGKRPAANPLRLAKYRNHPPRGAERKLAAGPAHMPKLLSAGGSGASGKPVPRRFNSCGRGGERRYHVPMTYKEQLRKAATDMKAAETSLLAAGSRKNNGRC